MHKRFVFPVVIALIVALAAVIFFLSANTPSNSSDHDSPPSVKFQSITKDGELVCLPHRDSSGPQTLECAFGLKDDQGVYFGLRDQAGRVSRLPTGQRIRVTGSLTMQKGTKYQDSGYIEVESATEL